MAAGVGMGGIVVSQKTYLRDDSGKFLSAVDAGATAAVKEIVETIANLAIAFAPFRHGILKGSIQGVAQGHTGFAKATAKHAAPQEFGAGPHELGAPGQWLGPGEDGWPGGFGPVRHPGNPATRFMTKAGTVVAAMSGGIVRKHMPG
jgi:hypothetical protein